MTATITNLKPYTGAATRTEQVRRTEDTATAHGLRQHSIGSVFPVIIVGRGINPTTWEVHLGEHFCPRLTLSAAHDLAAKVAEVHRKHGWDAAVRFLTNWNIKVNINS